MLVLWNIKLIFLFEFEFNFVYTGKTTSLYDSLYNLRFWSTVWFKSQFFILLAAAVVVHRQAFFSDNAAMSASSHRIMASASVEWGRRPLLLKIIRVKCATPDEEQAAAAAFILVLVNHDGGHQRTKCLTHIQHTYVVCTSLNSRNNHPQGKT